MSDRKNYKNYFASLKSVYKGVGSGVGSGSGSVSQRYGSVSQRYGSADPDPHQNVMDPQHWIEPLLFGVDEILS